jgi:hypothetical protein
VKTWRKRLRRRLPASLKARMSMVVFLLVLGAVALLALATWPWPNWACATSRGASSVSLSGAAVFIDEELDAKRNVLRAIADSLAPAARRTAPACSASCPRRRCWPGSIRPASSAWTASCWPA